VRLAALHAFFLPRDAMLALYTLSSCVYRSSRFDKYRLDKQTDGQSWFLVWELPELYYKQIRILQEIRLLPSGTLSQTVDLENFATASR